MQRFTSDANVNCDNVLFRIMGRREKYWTYFKLAVL